jgi:hypothetical protein
MRQAVGITDGDHEIADAHAFRIADGHFRQAIGLDFDQRDVCAGIRTDDLGIKGAPVNQRNLDFISLANDMMIGQDIAVLCVDDDTLREY